MTGGMIEEITVIAEMTIEIQEGTIETTGLINTIILVTKDPIMTERGDKPIF